MKKIIIVLAILIVPVFGHAGSVGLWRIWMSSFTSDNELETMRDDIALLNNARLQPPEYHFEMFNVSTNTVSDGIAEGNYSTELIIDTDTVEGLMSGHPDLEKLSSVKDLLTNEWIIRVGTKTWSKDGWIRDSQFYDFNNKKQNFMNRYKYEVKNSTP